MFTGIVEEMGVVRQTRPGTLVIGASLVLGDLKLGDSVSVDGACLTVVERTDRTFTVNVEPETLRRTTLGERSVGSRVNLERALPINGRLGGHIVEGHVDATGRLAELRPDGDGLIARFEAPANVLRYVVTKGFIAINGVSLTVVDVGDEWFTVALIPFTRENVNLLDGGAGAKVNLEVDILAKYVERLVLRPIAEGSATSGRGLTIEKLKEAGFVPS
jgi:riboflavin synthase